MSRYPRRIDWRQAILFVVEAVVFTAGGLLILFLLVLAAGPVPIR